MLPQDSKTVDGKRKNEIFVNKGILFMCYMGQQIKLESGRVETTTQ
jgi:hypothetical protein